MIKKTETNKNNKKITKTIQMRKGVYNFFEKVGLIKSDNWEGKHED